MPGGVSFRRWFEVAILCAAVSLSLNCAGIAFVSCSLLLVGYQANSFSSLECPSEEDIIAAYTNSMGPCRTRDEEDDDVDPVSAVKPAATTGSALAPPDAPAIPCLGVVVGADPNLFMLRLLYSIDHPVEHLVIAYGGNETTTQSEINHLKNGAFIFNNITTVHLGRWPGVAIGWNKVIKTCGDAAPWYMILNVDIQFIPGSLAKFSKNFTADVEASTSDFGSPICANIGDGKNGCGFIAFALSKRMRDTVGYFDENIFPAYYEDGDYWRRLVASKLPSKIYPESKVWHSWRQASQSSSRFLTKSTSSVTFVAIQRAAQRYTVPYLKEKWGCDKDADDVDFAKCTYKVPWNKMPLQHWTPPADELQTEKMDFLFAESALR